MDVDSPSGLKRCSSAPIINEINPNTTMTTSPTTNTTNRDAVAFNIFAPCNQPRTRRFSASFSPLTHSPNSGPRLTPRVSQLRQEECVDLCNREVNHEREVHSAMQMSQSWEDLTLVTESLSCKTSEDKRDAVSAPKDMSFTNPLRFTKDPHLSPKMMPLNLQIQSSGPLVCSSPSPTRPGLGRQCFSPGFLKNTLSPSPTRKAFATRRSLSPIAMRPSSLGSVKRKFELDEDKDCLMPSAKLLKTSTQTFTHGSFVSNCNNHTPTSNLLTSHNTSSPIMGSLSSTGTPESISSSDSANFTFRPVNSPSPRQIIDEPMQEDRISSNVNNIVNELNKSSDNIMHHGES